MHRGPAATGTRALRDMQRAFERVVRDNEPDAWASAREALPGRRVVEELERLDARAEPRFHIQGAPRPWYVAWITEMAERAGDEEILAVVERLAELWPALYAAQQERQELEELLREWEPYAELIDRVRAQ